MTKVKYQLNHILTEPFNLWSNYNHLCGFSFKLSQGGASKQSYFKLRTVYIIFTAVEFILANT